MLVFLTGANVAPSLGFDQSPPIEFLHQDEDECTQYTKANTCSVIFYLPSADYYEKFKCNVIFGIGNARGFAYT